MLKMETQTTHPTTENTMKTPTQTTQTRRIDPYRATYHRDATVTIWNVYTQSWLRTGRPSDRILANLDDRKRERVIRHCQIEA
jgi:hypothetical protein